MAMLNEILGAASRLNELLTRKFNITGGAPSPQVTPEWTPVTLLSDPEDRILARERLYGGFINGAAVAAKNVSVRLRNPDGSNLVAVVTLIQITPAVGGDTVGISLGYQGTDLAQLPTVPGPACRDTRAGDTISVPTSACKLTFDNSPPGIAGSNIAQLVNSGNFVPVSYTEPIIIGPGGSLDIFNSTVNAQVIYTLAWRERPIAPGEVGPF